jgi:hypothetical protein
MQGWSESRVALVAILLFGCSDPLDAPSGYEDQTFLCEAGAQAARQARTKACNADAACSGWVSLSGMLQDQPVTVSSELRNVRLDAVKAPGVGLVREAITIRAESPYFALRWVFSALPPLEATTETLALPISISQGDGSVHSALRLEGGGASVEFSGRDGQLLTSWTAQEQSGDAHVNLGSGNVVDGCFFARVSIESKR